MLLLLFCLINMPDLFSSFRQCECGIANNVSPGRNAHTRIVGGTSYIPHKYPWLVLVKFNGTFLCGGTIVSDQYILSAAHCLANIRIDPSYLKIVVGEYNTCKEDTKNVILSVNKIIRHHNFNVEDFSGDILLLKISMKLSFNKFIRPICLPPFDINNDVPGRYRGEKAIVTGWGQLRENIKQTSCIPQELTVPILQRTSCGEQIASSLFCAGFTEGGKDSCQGDSGSPLQIPNKYNRFEIIGIVSNGVGCALPNYPGLYTDITRYLPWIWKNIRDSHFCW